VNLRLRSLYAIAIPSVCRLSVCLWRWCTLLSRLKFLAIFLRHAISQGLFPMPKFVGGGRPFSPEICVESNPPPFKQRNFDQYRLIVIASKNVQLALIGSRPRAFQRAIDEPCTLSLSPPKSGTKTRYRCLCQ